MLQNKDSGNSQTAYSSYFIISVSLFITCLITANITAVKLISVFGLIMPAAIIIFPISYILGDVFTEVYGYRQTRRVIWLGFFCNLFLVVVVYIGLIIPAASFWDGQASYERILGYTPRILAASFLAYLTGEFSNSFVLAKIKIATRGKWLWVRTITSTLIGQGLDSLIFITLSFVGTMPAEALLLAILTQWIVKSLYEAMLTPITYKVVNFLKIHEGLDAYDYDTNFSPLTFSRQ